MTRRLFIECGGAETRAALLIDGDVWRVWFGPARGDEAIDTAPQPGRRFAARVQRVDQALDAAFLALGETGDGFLALTKSNQPHCIEGAMMAVEVKSPPRQGKGAVLRFIEPLGADIAPGRLPPFDDPILEAVESIGIDAAEIVVDTGSAKRLLEENSISNVIHDARAGSILENCGAAEAVSSAFDRSVGLDGGGSLYIDETEALTAIDVDTGAQSASSNARLREKFAFSAASETARQISLRSIGGHVVIDFPALKGEGARKRFNDHLRNVMEPLGISAASFSKSGLFSFTTPRQSLSLLERFTEPDGGAPIAGRKFTMEAVAKNAIWALETRLRSTPSSRFRLAVGRDIEAYLSERSPWRERLGDRYGWRFEIVNDAHYKDRDYDLSEQ